MSTVLVTGAGGFIGRHCLPRLAAAGYEIHAVTTRAAPEPKRGLAWHRADLFDAPGVRALVRKVSPSHLLHLAWVTEPGKYWTSPENERWLEASRRLFDAFPAAGGRRTVGVGTCAEYDWAEGRLVEGRTALLPRTPYARAKDALRRHLEALASPSHSVAWARLFFLYGPGEDPARVHHQYAKGRMEFREALVEVVAEHLPGPPEAVEAECERLLDLLG